MKKNFYYIITLMMIAAFTPVHAAEYEPLEIGMYDNSFQIDGQEIILFETFRDNDLAYQAIVGKYETELNGLMVDYSLEPISPNNVQSYNTACSIEVAENTNDDLIQLYSYLDAYLFRYENDSIIELSTQYNLTGDQNILLEIDLRTPYTSNKVYNRPVSNRYVSFNVNNAVAYAKKHTYTHNPAYRSYGSDCTNFASQIAFAGGIPITNGANMDTGWYAYSATWVNANRFANWYGIWNSSKSHSWFSVQASRGDFVALDYDSNGKWDHIGFVVDKDNYQGTYTNSYGKSETYYDYRIAQHTSDYDSWASWDSCSWEEAWDTKNATYGIILTPH